MRRGSSLEFYRRRRRCLVSWKFEHELSDDDQQFLLFSLLAKGQAITLEWVQSERWFCCFSGRVDRRSLIPVHPSVT